MSDGRFEVYLDGTLVYSRKEAGDGDFLTSLRALRKVRPLLIERLDRAPVPVGAH
ncbi:MAG: hypothetical protein HYU30_05005 [Chloroflexi bacterium]|nr:hypothetical protein [Chloroflexota bacterium]